MSGFPCQMLFLWIYKSHRSILLLWKNLLQEIFAKEVTVMAVHHGGKVGKAAKTLASSSSSNKAKSQAGKTLAKHKAVKH